MLDDLMQIKEVKNYILEKIIIEIIENLKIEKLKNIHIELWCIATS